MPFTPLHLGPGAAFKAIGGKHFSFMVFGGAQVLMDIEPLLGILQGKEVLHGYSHTLLGALLIGLLAGLIGRPISIYVLKMLKIPHAPFSWLASFSGAFIGTFSHIGFDAIMHSDMNPWWPVSTGNSWLSWISIDELHILCLALGLLGALVISRRYFLNGRAKLHKMASGVTSPKALPVVAAPKMSMTFSPLNSLVAVCILPMALYPLIDFFVVAPFGSAMLLWLKLFFFLPLLLVLPVFAIAPFLLFSRSLRPSAVRSIGLATIFVFAMIIGLLLGEKVRMNAFNSLAERSETLIQAIYAYQSAHGSLPGDLANLVPEFLPSVPGTGMAAYPDYDYLVGEKAASYDGNPWVLVVFAPSGGINFDTFMYFPVQNYPEHGYGGVLERIADWAYVHE